MKKLTILIIAIILNIGIISANAAQNNDPDVVKIHDKLCGANESCKDIVAINLNGAYYEGLNEKQDVTIGTLINRKSKSLVNLCDGLDISVCKEYKDQLMLRYIKGLLSR